MDEARHGWDEVHQRLRHVSRTPERRPGIKSPADFLSWYRFNRTLAELQVDQLQAGADYEARAPNGDLVWRRTRIDGIDELVEAFYPSNVPMDFGSVPSSVPHRPVVMSVRGISRGGRWHGRWEQWFSDGSVSRITDWNAGIRSGKNIVFHSSGRLARADRFCAGNRHGRCKSFHENGRIETLTDYRHGVVHGVRVQWFVNGQLQIHGRYGEGGGCGKYRSWFESGQPKKLGHLRNGAWVGAGIEWSDDGDVVRTWTGRPDTDG